MRIVWGGEGWRPAAARLGLALHDPTGTFERGASFARIKRAMGGPTMAGRDADHWMYGRWPTGRADEKVEVVVLKEETTHQDNSGMTSRTTHTHVVARIDPPLFAGLDVTTKSFLPFFEPPPTGNPMFDGICTLKAFAPATLAGLFHPDASHRSEVIDLLAQIKAGPMALSMTDSTVDLHVSHRITEPEELAVHLGAAARLAALIAARRATVVRTPIEEARIATWQSFGTSSGLELDRERMILSGTVAGAKVRLGLEGEPMKLCTVLVVEWPRSLGLGLSITRQHALHSIAEFFGAQDIRIGDVAFDDAFVIKGDAMRIPHALADAAMRRALLELALAAVEVVVDDGRLVVRWPMPVERELELTGAVQRVQPIVRALCPAAV